jgi:hypothetical protein
MRWTVELKERFVSVIPAKNSLNTLSVNEKTTAAVKCVLTESLRKAILHWEPVSEGKKV